MKTVKSVLLLIIIALFANSCSLLKKKAEPGRAVAHLTDTTKLTDASLVYALPMTVFTIKIGMEREMEIPGPYSKYAEVLLGLEDAILAENENWRISSVSVSSHEEADPSEFYVIEAEDILPSNVLSLKREGFILDLNPETSHNDALAFGREININDFLPTDLGSDEYFIVQTDTAYRYRTLHNQTIRVPYAVEKNKKLTTDELAQRAARRLLDLRDGKMMILTGEANVFPQSSAAIDEINRLEKEYTELFTGKSTVESRTFQFKYIPRIGQTDKAVPLFLFSESEGPSEKGIPVSIFVTPEQKTKDLTVLSRQQPVDTEQKYNRLYYRIPDVVNVKILMGEKPLYESRRLVYQLGEVMQLPANYLTFPTKSF